MIMNGKDSHAPVSFPAFKALVESRQSYKLPFSSEVVDPGLIEACIDCARWAPSAHNEQPWRFIIFYRQDEAQQEIRSAMLDAMQERYEADLLLDGRSSSVNRDQTSNERFQQAPVLIIALLDVSVMDAYPDELRQHAERVMGEQSVAACLQTFLLALHAAGLKACWYCAPLFAETTIYDVLHLAATMIPQAFIATGYGTNVQGAGANRYDRRMASGMRRPVSEIIWSPVDLLKQEGDDSA